MIFITLVFVIIELARELNHLSMTGFYVHFYFNCLTSLSETLHNVNKSEQMLSYLLKALSSFFACNSCTQRIYALDQSFLTLFNVAYYYKN
ncbi:MAG TPA: hypothetical protein DCP31_11340 [Cyanobacteria bacterium UBA8543]|nr:hypothetical protein [Cyanobacteria bacterium UBA8543]